MDRHEKIAVGIHECAQILTAIDWPTDGSKPNWYSTLYHRCMPDADATLSGRREEYILRFNQRMNGILAEMMTDFPLVDNQAEREAFTKEIDRAFKLKEKLDVSRADVMRDITPSVAIPPIVIHSAIHRFGWPIRTCDIASFDAFADLYKSWLMPEIRSIQTAAPMKPPVHVISRHKPEIKFEDGGKAMIAELESSPVSVRIRSRDETSQHRELKNLLGNGTITVVIESNAQV